MHPEVLSDSGRELAGELPVSLFEQGFHLAGGTGLNLYHVARSLAWFEDADAEPDPVLLILADWNRVRRFFREKLSEFEAALLAP